MLCAPPDLLEGANFFEMPVKAALDKWYGAMRIFGFLIGLAWAAIGLFLYYGPLPLPLHLSLGGLLPMGIVMAIVWPLALSPPARRASVAWLGRLGSAAEERKAAAVAAFMGEIGSEKALALGKQSFVGLRWKSFTAADLSNTDLAAKSGLRSRTMKLRLGACDAFLSHSWHARRWCFEPPLWDSSRFPRSISTIGFASLLTGCARAEMGKAGAVGGRV